MPYIIDHDNVIPINVNNKCDSKPLFYPAHDLSTVFTHWDDKLKCNVATPNKLSGDKNKLDNGGINKNGEG